MKRPGIETMIAAIDAFNKEGASEADFPRALKTACKYICFLETQNARLKKALYGDSNHVVIAPQTGGDDV